MTKPLILNADERNALYRTIVARLSGIDYVYTAIEAEDWETADSLSREFSDLLRLIQDLGWGDDGTQAVLSTPPDVLYRALSGLKERAEIERREEKEEQDILSRRLDRVELVREVCEQQLATIAAQETTADIGAREPL